MHRRDIKILSWLVGIFLIAWFLPLSNPKVRDAIIEAFKMLQWYVRNHTLACVVPALFIAGAISTLLSQQAVLRHLGPKASKVEAYSTASVSGTILAVCSCSVLPMFAGIYQVGAGLGPATAFLYSGPAINILALLLTARVLGMDLGLARGVGAIVFGVVIGILMALIFRKDEARRQRSMAEAPEVETPTRRRWQTILFFVAMLAFLIFSDWYNPGNVDVTMKNGETFAAVQLKETRGALLFQLSEPAMGKEAETQVEIPKDEIAHVESAQNWVMTIYHYRWWLAAVMGVATLFMTFRWLSVDERHRWMENTWDFTKLLVPLLFGGVFVVGFLGALLPDEQVARLVGDNSLFSNLVASIVGCLFYFATLTEIPILQSLMQHGMHRGPALALLLAGPALSLPSLMVIKSIIGLKKTAVFTGLVIVFATLAGMIYGGMA